jgi:hypothetical protein
MIIVSIVIFCIVLLLYLHIMFHLKVSDDLDVYDLGMVDKNKLETACNLRHPLKFKSSFQALKEVLTVDAMKQHHGNQTVNVINTDDNSILPLQLEKALDLFSNSETETYHSMENSDFIDRAGLTKAFASGDDRLKPSLTVSTKYDLIWSSNGGSTRLGYTLDHRNYYHVTQGKCVIRLFPPNTEQLRCTPDYARFEFTSPINPFIPNEKYRPALAQCRYTDVFLEEDDTVFVPPYWWHAVKLVDTCCLAVYRYSTVMSSLSVAPHLLRHVLQRHNVVFTPAHVVPTAKKLEDPADSTKIEEENLPKDAHNE